MSSSFSLHPVTSADVLALAELSGLSFETDRHTQLKAAHPSRPYNHAAGMVDGFQYWLSQPKNKVELTKAVDNKTGQILGYVCWGFRLEQPHTHDEQQEEVREDEETNDQQKPPNLAPEDYVKANSPELDALAHLEEITSTHLAEYQGRIMPPGTRAMYVITISVHPAHHGKGVGTALVRRGTGRADAERVFCWVHSSEDGVAMFRKCGFEVNNTLDVDLDHWAGQMDVKPPAGDEKWGTYTFRYMLRQPSAV